MNKSGFTKIFWGFLFIMLSPRVHGFDILPDIVGYILFFVGLKQLTFDSQFFEKCKKCSIIMIIVSIFTIYQRPIDAAHSNVSYMNVLDKISLPASLVALVLGLYIVYNLLMGIKEMCKEKNEMTMHEEAGGLWTKYMCITIGSMVLVLFYFIPILVAILAIVLGIASIVVSVKIMIFIRKCQNVL